MDNLKIAIIVKRFQDKNFCGGGEKIMFNLIKQLCKKNFEVDLYCVESNVVDDYGLSNIFYLNSSNYYEESMKLMNNDKYKAVVSEGINNIATGITIVMGHSFVYRISRVRSSLQTFFYKFTGRYKNYKNTVQAYKQKVQKYNKIFALSSLAKDDYTHFLGAEEKKVHVVYPGVDMVKDPILSTNSVYTFGLSAPGFDRKGGYILLKALSYLKRSNNSFKAKIIYPKYSKNGWVKFLVWIYGIKKNVEFIQFQRNMDEFYKTIDCLVVPSKEETFGMVATEAMANKRLVIASSRCGVSEVIKNNDNGFIFSMKGNAAKNLAKKMKLALDNRPNNKQIIESGYATAQNLSWEYFCDKFIEYANLELSRN